MNEDSDDYKELIEVSKQLPAEFVLATEKTLKDLFEKGGTEYTVNTLRAARETVNLIHSGMPPVYGQVLAQLSLCLTRLIHELDTGIITSPIQKP